MFLNCPKWWPKQYISFLHSWVKYTFLSIIRCSGAHHKGNSVYILTLITFIVRHNFICSTSFLWHILLKNFLSQNSQTNNITPAQKTAVNKSIWIECRWKRWSWLNECKSLLFNYSSPAGSDSKSDCWRATLCPKVKYVGSARLFDEQSMQIYIDRQFIHCFFFFIYPIL